MKKYAEEKELPVKILLLGHQKRFYGTYWRLKFLARGLVKLKHDVTLAAVSCDARWISHSLQEEGVDIWEGPNLLHDLPGQGTGPLDILGRIKLISQNKFDVIHGFEFFPNIRIPIRLTNSRKKTVVLSDWCDWYSRGGLGPRWGRYPWVKKMISRQEDNVRIKSHGVTVISQKLKERTLRLGISQDKILYLPGGAPVDIIRVEDKKKARRRWKIDPQAKVIVFMGTNQADLDILLEAFAIVAKKEVQSLLLLAGPKNKKMRRQAYELGIEKNIIETDIFKYSDLSSILACADVCALPMRDTEGNQARWPNKIGEYMAAGRPIVTSAVGEMKYLFKEYPMGIAVEQDARQFAKALIVLLLDSAKNREMGKVARKVAEEVLAWDRLSLRLEEFYKKMLYTLKRT